MWRNSPIFLGQIAGVLLHARWVSLLLLLLLHMDSTIILVLVKQFRTGYAIGDALLPGWKRPHTWQLLSWLSYLHPWGRSILITIVRILSLLGYFQWLLGLVDIGRRDAGSGDLFAKSLSLRWALIVFPGGCGSHDFLNLIGGLVLRIPLVFEGASTNQVLKMMLLLLLGVNWGGISNGASSLLNIWIVLRVVPWLLLGLLLATWSLARSMHWVLIAIELELLCLLRWWPLVSSLLDFVWHWAIFGGFEFFKNCGQSWTVINIGQQNNLVNVSGAVSQSLLI